jgi:peptide/nickel transport system permease protein
LSLITFVLLYLLPADPARQIAGRSATPQTVANIRQQLGLDQPLRRPVLALSANLLSGDLGRSYIQRSESGADRRAPAGQPAADGWRHPRRADARLSMGLIAAVKRGTATDQDR